MSYYVSFVVLLIALKILFQKHSYRKNGRRKRKKGKEGDLPSAGSCAHKALWPSSAAFSGR